VWTGGASQRDAHLRELAETTFEGGPWDTGRLTPEEMDRARLAKKVFRLAHIHQMLGDLENAERLYRRSLEAFPTSEAHTFLGWTYSFLNRLEDAMRECREAIDVDPTLGNPYNDIGAYLIELGRPDEAVAWLKRATQADRYCCAFYAHCNLGRVFMLRGDLVAAREEFARALDVNPEYELARQLLEEVEKHL
ncbi:MAG: tetratricopeptide repeat protein, partial [Thermoplasmata archaeon]